MCPLYCCRYRRRKKHDTAIYEMYNLLHRYVRKPHRGWFRVAFNTVHLIVCCFRFNQSRAEKKIATCNDGGCQNPYSCFWRQVAVFSHNSCLTCLTWKFGMWIRVQYTQHSHGGIKCIGTKSNRMKINAAFIFCEESIGCKFLHSCMTLVMLWFSLHIIISFDFMAVVAVETMK